MVAKQEIDAAAFVKGYIAACKDFNINSDKTHLHQLEREEICNDGKTEWNYYDEVISDLIDKLSIEISTFKLGDNPNDLIAASDWIADKRKRIEKQREVRVGFEQLRNCDRKYSILSANLRASL